MVVHRTSQETNGTLTILSSSSKTAEPFSRINSTIQSYDSYTVETWLYSIGGAGVVGLTGILPILFLPNIEHGYQSKKQKNPVFVLLLSVAVGSLLGDVFLHLLPETWSRVGTDKWSTIIIGVSLLSGFLFFMLIEKIFPDASDQQEADEENVFSHKRDEPRVDQTLRKRQTTKQTTGWLNLLANMIDNFTHGLAIGGSFAFSNKVGYTTLVSVIIHEIPHELGDFAILLKAGFTRWDAAKAQILTATSGIFGALFALYSSSIVDAGARTVYVLPFTSGGFLFVALVKTVPDLLENISLRDTFLHVIGIMVGLSTMAAVVYFFD
ncbi:unnamed protein product [Didymodactylos carnosus]|uniref:Zinc transporter n=1 Tax=Didymodactylos carnosus TaxID=1234261 RepID=A0A814FMU3_9BILA|nr:unnamed protein product [Didymodactylos carnosus]CAF0984925.1 unnamed protein product [Didymodactylos carnosus]CAF3562716.1 unnamed protein product [Didymodactylos carnosus]CAF3757198.1 unnamed protein product [Didymodactylos carnosus]